MRSMSERLSLESELELLEESEVEEEESEEEHDERLQSSSSNTCPLGGRLSNSCTLPSDIAAERALRGDVSNVHVVLRLVSMVRGVFGQASLS
mmetsp:Transcript_108650/g.203856  ORF Transcript_108650/g.203856 Transcript_108650/m.203856 type:complete len:93 (+) Transcript_108650:54-332(+)